MSDQIKTYQISITFNLRRGICRVTLPSPVYYSRKEAENEAMFLSKSLLVNTDIAEADITVPKIGDVYKNKFYGGRTRVLLSVGDQVWAVEDDFPSVPMFHSVDTFNGCFTLLESASHE